MDPNSIIIFVCEHGAAKSVLAAAYFNNLASQMGLGLKGSARGTNPDDAFSSQTVEGLADDGLAPTESAPKKLTAAELQAARHVITFCVLPGEYPQPASIEHWEDIPPIAENYVKARDVIVAHIHQMLRDGAGS